MSYLALLEERMNDFLEVEAEVYSLWRETCKPEPEQKLPSIIEALTEIKEKINEM